MSAILDDLAKLSSAEQFFQALGLPFEQEVLNVSRLHILKRFHDLLDRKAMADQPDDAVELACRLALYTAYKEFAAGSGKKTFKVFRQSPGTGFFPLAELVR